jgi:hypothetical protein
MHSEDMTGALGRNEVIDIAKQSVDGVGSTYEAAPAQNALAPRCGRQYPRFDKHFMCLPECSEATPGERALVLRAATSRG